MKTRKPSETSGRFTTPHPRVRDPREAPPQDTQGLRLPVTFRALRSPGYRLFFSGQLVSLMGTWIQIAALNWLVYHIGGSTRDIGLVSLAAAIPLLPFSLLGGALVDRVSRKKFIFTTQLILMVQAFGLYFLVAAGDPRVWQIMALSVVLGAGTAMDHPARQAFVVDVLERREDLINAVALNATLFNLARTVGPAIAGILLATGSESLPFLINGISYLAALLAIGSVRYKGRPARKQGSVLKQLKDGFRYSRDHDVVREILGLTAVSAFFVMPFMTLMPAFAKEILGAGPSEYGFVLSSVGVGAMAGGLFVASLSVESKPGRLFAMGFLGLPAFIIAFSQSRVLWMGIALAALSGVFFVIQNSLANTLIQSSIQDAFRGRVMSFYSLIFQAAFRVGALAIGELASHIGISLALGLTALIPLAYGLRLLSRGANFWGVALRGKET